MSNKRIKKLLLVGATKIIYLAIIAFFLLLLIASIYKIQQKYYNKVNYSIRESNIEMVKQAEKLAKVTITPTFRYSYEYMLEGVIQHLDRGYTYDVIPDRLKNGLLFQGIHRPPKGTIVEIELLEPATIYFFFHSEVDGGYTEIFAKLYNWKKSTSAPQYDVNNGDHGLKMVMYELAAQPGMYTIPATTKDRACFNMVFQTE